jgi:hypothetical protein
VNVWGIALAALKIAASAIHDAAPGRMPRRRELTKAGAATPLVARSKQSRYGPQIGTVESLAAHGAPGPVVGAERQFFRSSNAEIYS